MTKTPAELLAHGNELRDSTTAAAPMEAWQRKSMQVAETILQQLGGKQFAMMTGSKNFAGTENSLTFAVGGGAKKAIKYVRITLDPSDTYTMEFMNRKGSTVAIHSDVYADKLAGLFTDETGFYTKF